MKIGPSLFAAILLGVSAMHPSSADGAAPGGGSARIDSQEHRPFVVPGARTNAGLHRPAPRTYRVERNAIGLATERQRLPERNLVSGAGAPLRPSAPTPALSPVPTDVNHIVTNNAVAKGDDGSVRPGVVPVTPAPPVSPTVMNRGAINGTGMIRPFHAPGVIGGPAKTVASINGTTIRLRH